MGNRTKDKTDFLHVVNSVLRSKWEISQHNQKSIQPKPKRVGSGLNAECTVPLRVLRCMMHGHNGLVHCLVTVRQEDVQDDATRNRETDLTPKCMLLILLSAFNVFTTERLVSTVGRSSVGRGSYVFLVVVIAQANMIHPESLLLPGLGSRCPSRTCFPTRHALSRQARSWNSEATCRVIVCSFVIFGFCEETTRNDFVARIIQPELCRHQMPIENERLIIRFVWQRFSFTNAASFFTERVVFSWRPFFRSRDKVSCSLCSSKRFPCSKVQVLLDRCLLTRSACKLC